MSMLRNDEENVLMFDIVVIGAGGTGSYFLKEFSRYLYQNDKAKEHIFRMAVMDGDEVEEKNLKRQAFIEDDIGMPKSVVMASALNDAFSLGWTGYDRYLLRAEELDDDCYHHDVEEGGVIPIIVGCVDNHACRMVCEEFFNTHDNCIYYDSANEFSSGEVVFSVKKGGEVLSPLRSSIFPEIKKGDLRNVEELSCTELNEVAPQHIAANMNAGLILLSAMTTLFEEGVVTGGMTMFDVKQMYCQHFAASELNVRSES